MITHKTTRMSLCVLGSGSSGNCSVLAFDGPGAKRRITLIDAGLSPRETVRRLDALGIGIEDVNDILITHFDSDHFHQGWVRGATRYGLTLRFHTRHRGWAQRRGALENRCEPFTDQFDLHDLAIVTPIRLMHDDLGTVGFRIESPAGVLGFATDLGRVERSLLDAFTDLHILAIESNYCPRMQHESSRPMFLKRRIMGGRGHISNHESLSAVTSIASRSPELTHIVKLHLSQQCNDPHLIRCLYADRAGHLVDKLVFTDPRSATPWLHVQADPAVTVRTTAPVSSRLNGAQAASPTTTVQPTLW